MRTVSICRCAPKTSLKVDDLTKAETKDDRVDVMLKNQGQWRK